MPQAATTQILDIDAHWDDQDSVRMVNAATKALEDAAYWRGKCDGLEVTLAYLKDRLVKAESYLLNPKPIVMPAESVVCLAAEGRDAS